MIHRPQCPVCGVRHIPGSLAQQACARTTATHDSRPDFVPPAPSGARGTSVLGPDGIRLRQTSWFTEEEERAILAWTGMADGIDYLDLPEALRSNSSAVMDPSSPEYEVIQVMDGAFSHHQTEEEIVLYRGVESYDPVAWGQHDLLDLSYMVTSFDRSIAISHADSMIEDDRNPPGTLFEIVVPRGTFLVPVSQVVPADGYTEAEYLIPRGSRLQFDGHDLVEDKLVEAQYRYGEVVQVERRRGIRVVRCTLEAGN